MAALAACPVLPVSASLCGSGLARRASARSVSNAFALRKSFNGATLQISNKKNVSVRSAPLKVRGADQVTSDTSEEIQNQANDLIEDLKAKWEKVENKSTVAIYAGGALVTIWFSSTIVGAVNAVPLLPKVLELVGLGYTGWFVYRYLLFKSSRKELVEDIEVLKGKITGATSSIQDKVDGSDV